jgi:DNA-binding GntR family transcriptional regulator
MTLAKFAGEPPPPIAILKTEDSVLKGQPNIREDLSMSRTQRVYEELLRRIISGEIAQGAFLSEIKLATDFQSSRTPIREACIHLFKEGFLRVAPHKGYVVTEVSLEEIRELYELRQVLEPRAAERAAANDLGPEFRTECEELIQLTRQLSEGERTYEAFIQLGQAEYGFHRAIAKAGGNKKWLKFMDEIMNQFRRFHFVCFRTSPWIKGTVDEHARILDAICSHQVEKAGVLMQRHVTEGAERGLQLFIGAVSNGSRVWHQVSPSETAND